MRSTFNISLLVLLVVQIILVAVMYSGHGAAEATPTGPWLQLDMPDLDQLSISDDQGGGTGHSVTLKRMDGGWVIPAKFGFPVDTRRLQHLLGSLDKARPELPVAVSTQARTRFHVAKDKFERHLVFKSEQGTVADLYLGKSAGAGRVYARRADQDAIQNLRLSLWRASADASDWLDKAFLQPDLGQQQQIKLPNVSLVHAGNLWQPRALADGRLPDPDKIATLIQRLRTLRWDKLLGTTTSVQLAPQPTFEVTVTPKKGAAVTYRFYRQAPPAAHDQTVQDGAGSKDQHASPGWRVTRSDADFVLTIDDALVEPLLKANPHDLSMAKTTDAGLGDGQASQTGATAASAGDGTKAGDQAMKSD